MKIITNNQPSQSFSKMDFSNLFSSIFVIG